MPSESSKIMAVVVQYLKGQTVLDLGCGDEKVVPWAIGVDDASEWLEVPKAVGIKVKVNPESKGLDILHQRPEGGLQDVIFSSHCLEHLRCPIGETLRYWFSFVRPGGLLVLYLPDERFYVYAPAHPKLRNPAHFHLLTMDTFLWYAEQLPGSTIVKTFLDNEAPGHYSFLVVIRKDKP